MCRLIGEFNIDLLLVNNILICIWLCSRIIIVNDKIEHNGDFIFFLLYVEREWKSRYMIVNVKCVQVVVFRFRFYGLGYLVFYLLFVIIDNGWFYNNGFFGGMIVFCSYGLFFGSRRNVCSYGLDFGVQRLSYFGFLKFLVFCKWLERIMNHQKTLRLFAYGLPFGRLRR